MKTQNFIFCLFAAIAGFLAGFLYGRPGPYIEAFFVITSAAGTSSILYYLYKQTTP